MTRKMFVFLSLVVFTLTLALPASAKKLMLDDVHVISTFNVEFIGGTSYRVYFPKDQFQKELEGVKEVALWCGVDNDNDREIEKNFNPIVARLDDAGEYFVGVMDRSEYPGKFTGMFWAETMDGNKTVWANCDPSTSKVGADPKGLKTDKFAGYIYSFIAIEG